MDCHKILTAVFLLGLACVQAQQVRHVPVHGWPTCRSKWSSGKYFRWLAGRHTILVEF